MRHLAILVLLVLSGLHIHAQADDCTTAATNASVILDNAQTLLAQGNAEGAATLIASAQDVLAACQTQPQPSADVMAPTSAPEPTTTTETAITLNPPTLTADQTIAFVRFAHTSVDAGPLELYLDGATEPIVSDLAYGEVSDLIAIESGTRTFRARPNGAGRDGEQLYRLQWQFLSNSSWVVVAAGVREQLAFIVEPISILRDSYNGQARVRVINLLAGAPRLTVRDETGRVYGDGLGWVGLRDVLVDAGSFNFEVTTSDGRATALNNPVTLTAQTTTTLMAIGRGTDEQPVTLLAFNDPQNETRVRFVNEAAAPFDILMRPGNQPLVENLQPGTQTDFIALPSGSATFISYVPGTGPTGQEQAALVRQLRPGRDLTVAVAARQMTVRDVALTPES